VFAHVIALPHHAQVARIVIFLITVAVVHYLAWVERAPEHLLGNYAVFMPAVTLDISIAGSTSDAALPISAGRGSRARGMRGSLGPPSSDARAAL
jgi:hypothetical protein